MPHGWLRNGGSQFNGNTRPKGNETKQGIASKHDGPRAAANVLLWQRIDKCGYLIGECLDCVLGFIRLALLNFAGPIVIFNLALEHVVAFLVLLVRWQGTRMPDT